MLIMIPCDIVLCMIDVPSFRVYNMGYAMSSTYSVILNIHNGTKIYHF